LAEALKKSAEIPYLHHNALQSEGIPKPKVLRNDNAKINPHNLTDSRSARVMVLIFNE
tara:strand:+ start:3014 stop:3187 length:174 start_codon:yes stop_codon:yes gene_type:complete